MIEQQPVYCFLDTSILIQFRTFDEIDWPKVVSAPAVVLVLAPIVLAELNQHKDDYTNEWRRKRARTLVSKLKSFLGQTGSAPSAKVRPDVSLLDIPNEPVVDWATLGLDPAVNDDRLIAAVIKFCEQHPTFEAMIMTDDILLQRKAISHRIQFIDPEGRIAPIERLSDERAEVRRLEKQVQELKSRTAKPQIWFWEQGATTNTITRIVSTVSARSSSDAEIVQQVEQKQRKLEQLAASAPRSATQTEISKFVKAYEGYIQRLEQMLILKRTKDFGLSVQLQFVLQNTGTAPATDLELSLRFPKDSLVVGATDRLELEYWDEVVIPNEPVPDWIKAKNPFDYAALTVPYVAHSTEPPGQPRPKGPLYEQEDRSIVWFTTPKLRHKEDWHLKSVIAFLPPETRGGIAIWYSIHADDLLDKIEGQLNVVLQQTTP